VPSHQRGAWRCALVDALAEHRDGEDVVLGGSATIVVARAA
jgi:hypothetical protein